MSSPLNNKRILFLTAHPPFPPSSGDKIATLNTIKGLLKQGAIIDLLTLCDASDIKNLAGLEKFINGRLFTVKMPNKIFRIIIATLCGRSLVHSRFYSSEYLCRFKMMANDYEIIIANHSYMAQYISKAGPVVNALKLHDIHVLESNVMLMRSSFATNPLMKALFMSESRRLLSEENKYFQSFDRNYSYGDYETDLLKNTLGKVVKYRPIGISTDAFESSDGNEKTLIFFGDYKWFPNYNGIQYVLEKVFPKLRDRISDAKLIVAGRNADKKILALCSQAGVTFVGEVTDINKLLSECSYVLAPILIGGGVRLKVIESLAAGKIVISNTQSAEGILDKKVLIVDDDLDALIGKIENIMSDRESFIRMKRAAIDYVLKNHSIDAATSYLLDDIRTLVAEKNLQILNNG